MTVNIKGARITLTAAQIKKVEEHVRKIETTATSFHAVLTHFGFKRQKCAYEDAKRGHFFMYSIEHDEMTFGFLTPDNIFTLHHASSSPWGEDFDTPAVLAKELSDSIKIKL